MSITTSSLVLVLLCFSFHACYSRSFGVVDKETANEVHHSINNKKNEDLHSARVSSRPKAFEDAKDDTIFEERKMINSESNEQNGAKVSITTKTEYVSWRVPHKKRGEQEPGFNLDYLPPKTHPPVHN